MRTVPAALFLLFATPVGANAQWTWPERAENLQVLPSDFSGDRIRAVMTGFTRALGVGCAHCHVGTAGEPLSTYDFVSDDNPKKNVARAMLNLLGDVNETLGEIDFDREDRVNMWCHTCHRGAPRPQTLEEALTETYGSDGLQAMLDRYDSLRDEFYGRGTYDFGERSLNAFGYSLLGTGDTDAAIAVFRLNVKHHPGSSNVYDSLAEAYLARGDDDLARIYYSKALEIDPENENALTRLRSIASGE